MRAIRLCISTALRFRRASFLKNYLLLWLFERFLRSRFVKSMLWLGTIFIKFRPSDRPPNFWAQCITKWCNPLCAQHGRTVHYGLFNGSSRSRPWRRRKCDFRFSAFSWAHNAWTLSKKSSAGGFGFSCRNDWRLDERPYQPSLDNIWAVSSKPAPQANAPPPLLSSIRATISWRRSRTAMRCHC